MCLYSNLTVTIILDKHRAGKQSIFLLKIKKTKPNQKSSSHHLSGAAGRGSHCKWDRAGEQLFKGGEQRAGGVQEIQQKMYCIIACIFCAYALCINEQKVVWDRKGGKSPLRGLRPSVSYRFNYILALVNNLQSLVRNTQQARFLWCKQLRLQLKCEWVITLLVHKNSYSKPLNTFPLGRPNSLRAWKITFSVLPDAKVLVMLKQKTVERKKKTEKC